MNGTVDITPAPRILRVLGEIPFQPWRCLAELVDNSIDAFTEAKRKGIKLNDQRILVKWSSETVAAADRAVEIWDNAPGMELDQLRNAARAGYSGNDPINNLGLFGMGFNIATAKLGEKTRLLSATAVGDKWVGIEIDFAEMIKGRGFAAPMIEEPKERADEHGTKIVISNLKSDMYAALRNQEAQLRRQLEIIYTPLLDDVDVEIDLRGAKLTPRPHCAWGRTRYVSRGDDKVHAITDIDRDLGKALFDLEKNAYLSSDQEADARTLPALPPNIIERHKRLRGWVGIQRYSDPNDFGIDFVRNGRKILIGDKTLFSFENPMTGTSKLEYPVELGTTVGGRIVGEVQVDYLIPTYQKNDFDRNDISWIQTVEALRGVGPILPKTRKDLGYSDVNDSPIAILANAYRRPEPGTKNLAVDKAVASEYAERFRRGERDYISDDKWWEAAQEADRKKANKNADNAPEVDAGVAPSDDLDAYSIPGNASAGNALPTMVPPAPSFPSTNASAAASGSTTSSKLPETSELDKLLTKSKRVDVWSKSYGYGKYGALEVKVWELGSGKILDAGESVPCKFHSEGVDCDFIYNPRHPMLAQFAIEPRELLAIYLAEKFKARDSLPDMGNLFAKLVQLHLVDKRIDKVGLQERAASLFNRIRTRLLELLEPVAADAVACVHEHAGEVEETTNALLSLPDLLKRFTRREDSGLEALEFVPYRTLLRLIDRFPEQTFDGNLFNAPYAEIQLADEMATERTRNESKDRILSFLKDALWIIGQVGNAAVVGRGKDELARCSHSITFLEQEIID